MERHRHRQLLHQSPGEIVDRLKTLADISTPDDDMTDAEIKAAMRVAAASLPGDIPIDEHLTTGRDGIDLMLSLTLMVFPGYYERCGLAQFN